MKARVPNGETHRLASCAGKFGYHDAATARKVASKYHHIFVYHCRYCHLWHFGESRDPKRMRMGRPVPTKITIHSL